MTLTHHDLVSPFLSPPSNGAVEAEPRRPIDGSAEGMRRLRDPFAVNRAGAETGATDSTANDR
jgi:hypothetical protein